MRSILLLLALLSGSLAAKPLAEPLAEPLRVAVAANFRETLERIGDAFTAQTGTPLKISSASTGVLYSQALFGATFDLLLAADSLRPQQLVESGHALPDSRFTYAYGRLVLAYAEPLAGAGDIAALLALPGINLAIANPDLAPYGRAAAEVLAKHPLGEGSRLLTATNVGQAFQMWYAGGADLALVAASYRPATHRVVPRDWYAPIAQQAVILSDSRNPRLAREFLAFLAAEDARAMIEADGYLTAAAIDRHE